MISIAVIVLCEKFNVVSISKLILRFHNNSWTWVNGDLIKPNEWDNHQGGPLYPAIPVQVKL